MIRKSLSVLLGNMPKTQKTARKVSRYSALVGKIPRKAGLGTTTSNCRSYTTDTVVAIIQNLEDKFTANKDEQKAKKMKKYMRDQFDMYGLMSSERRSMVKQVFDSYSDKLTTDQMLDLLWQAWQKPEREFQMFATDYAMQNVKTFLGRDFQDCEPSFNTIKKLITNKSWWDTVDMLASNVVGPMVARYPSDLGKVMDRWIEDDNMWLRRTSILHQLKYKHKTDSEKLFRYCLQRADEKEFFIQKAIGWALREYGKSNRKEVKLFVTKHQDILAPLSVREALKHIK